jgi:hypothetical protein
VLRRQVAELQAELIHLRAVMSGQVKILPAPPRRQCQTRVGKIPQPKKGKAKHVERANDGGAEDSAATPAPPSRVSIGSRRKSVPFSSSRSKAYKNTWAACALATKPLEHREPILVASGLRRHTTVDAEPARLVTALSAHPRSYKPAQGPLLPDRRRLAADKSVEFQHLRPHNRRLGAQGDPRQRSARVSAGLAAERAHEAITVVLDLVNPVRPRRGTLGGGR